MDKSTVYNFATEDGGGEKGMPPGLDSYLDLIDGHLVLWYRRPGNAIGRRRIRDVEQMVILHRRIVRENGLPGSVRLGISSTVVAPEQWTRELAVIVLARNLMEMLKKNGLVNVSPSSKVEDA